MLKLKIVIVRCHDEQDEIKVIIIIIIIINVKRQLWEGVGKSNFTRSKVSFYSRSKVLLILAVEWIHF